MVWLRILLTAFILFPIETFAWTEIERSELAQKAADLLKLHLDKLADEGHHLVLVGRRGSDTSIWPWIKPDYQIIDTPRGKSLFKTLGTSIYLKDEDKTYFTHVGIALLDSPQSRNWTFRHKLRFTRKDPTERIRSGIFTQNLVEFFSDTPVTYDFIIFVLDPKIESRMYEELQFPKLTLAYALDSEAYNELADPFTGTEQNSNTWVLNQVVAAMSDHEQVLARGIPYIQQRLEALRFVPDFISVRDLPWTYQLALNTNINRFPFTLFGDFTTLEQNAYLDTLAPRSARFKYYGLVAPAVTVSSIQRFLEKQKVLKQVLRLGH